MFKVQFHGTPPFSQPEQTIFFSTATSPPSWPLPGPPGSSQTGGSHSRRWPARPSSNGEFSSARTGGIRRATNTGKPRWILKTMVKQNDSAYTDTWVRLSREYLSWLTGCKSEWENHGFAMATALPTGDPCAVVVLQIRAWPWIGSQIGKTWATEGPWALQERKPPKNSNMP